MFIVGGIDKGQNDDKQTESADLANQSLGRERSVHVHKTVIRVWGERVCISVIFDSNSFKLEQRMIFRGAIGSG